MEPHPRQLATFARIAEDGPTAARAFFAWYGEVTAGSSLGPRLAALIALATAHALRCPYCIDAWTTAAMQRGVDPEEMMAAVHLAAQVQATATTIQARLALDRVRRLELRETGDESAPYAERFTAAAGLEAEACAGPVEDALAAWRATTQSANVLHATERAAIALALAHALRCPHTIASSLALADAAGLTPAQQMEAVHVAAALQAGATLVHATLMRESAAEATP